MPTLPGLLCDLATGQGGVLSWPQLHRAGLSPSEVSRLVAHEVLVRVRRGGFVTGELWRAADPNRRFALTVRAALRYEALARDETVLARRARLAWLAYRMAMADRLFRDVVDPAVLDGLRWMLSTGITDGELFDASAGIPLDRLAAARANGRPGNRGTASCTHGPRWRQSFMNRCRP